MHVVLRDFLDRSPKTKTFLSRVRNLVLRKKGASTDFVRLDDTEIQSEASRLRNAWKDESIPKQQRQIVDEELRRFKAEKSVPVFDTLVKSLSKIDITAQPFSLLDVGCASGFYSEVIALSRFNCAYTGCDYSEPLIQLAHEVYPSATFDVQDATAMKYADASFDVVLSGCCLLHIPEYRLAISETARVARSHAIFHRTPVVLGNEPTRFFRKSAYGVQTVEIHLNEQEFLSLLDQQGFTVIQEHLLNTSISGTMHSATKTYVCEKRRAP